MDGYNPGRAGTARQVLPVVRSPLMTDRSCAAVQLLPAVCGPLMADRPYTAGTESANYKTENNNMQTSLNDIIL
jgi:hypothetical protein